MRLVKWERLPKNMQTEDVRKYYDVLRKKRFSLFLKRLFDVIVSLVLLLVLSPFFLILAIAIKLDSKGPVFYRQERITQYGKTFKITKFRTMVDGADKLGAELTAHKDARITRVGRFIRKFRLDEFSQLFDVLIGKMTLVGTRPEVPKYVKAYTPEMMATLLLPAGITANSSIYFAYEDRLFEGEDDIDKAYIEKILPKKMSYNLKALKNFGLMKDLGVILKTVLIVFGKKFKDKDLDE